jgi:hypothetical protein
MSRFPELILALAALPAGHAWHRASPATPTSAATPRQRKSPPGTSTCALISRVCLRVPARLQKARTCGKAKCASCHGIFGESNQVFSPLVGGTTAEPTSRRAGRHGSPTLPTRRTTLMKVSSLSTLWDYINRAMPWTQPKSLTVEEVYSVTAFC